MMKRIAVLAAFLAAAQWSHAATINSPDVSVSGLSGTWTFDQFNVSGATLTGVSFQLVSANAQLKVILGSPLGDGTCAGQGTGNLSVTGSSAVIGFSAPPVVGTCGTNTSSQGSFSAGTVPLLTPPANFVGSGTITLNYLTLYMDSFSGTGRLVYTYDAAVAGVPEPATMGLMGFGLGALGLLASRSAKGRSRG
jgi:hypothetical protein